MIDHSIVDIKPFSYAMSLIDGKWKMHILFWLWKTNVLRYGELKKALGNITHKMLSNQLKELEADGLIIRKEYPQVPPKVEYRLTEKGLSLMPVMQALCNWGHNQKLRCIELSFLAYYPSLKTYLKHYQF